MRVTTTLILVAIQFTAVYWWHDDELVGICAMAAFLVLITGGRHARR